MFGNRVDAIQSTSDGLPVDSAKTGGLAVKNYFQPGKIKYGEVLQGLLNGTIKPETQQQAFPG